MLISPDEVKAKAKSKENENYAFRTYLKMHADPLKLDEQFRKLHGGQIFIADSAEGKVVLIVLNLISERGEPYIIPLLLKWKEVEVRKIRNGIEHRQNQQRMKRMRGASICAMI